MAQGKPALQSFIESFVGGNFVVTVENVAVTTTPTRVLQNNFERMAAAIINVGANAIRVTPGQTVTSTMGIVLGDSGGNLSLSANEDLAMVGWDWWAQTVTSTSTVTVMYLTRYTGSTP